MFVFYCSQNSTELQLLLLFSSSLSFFFSSGANFSRNLSISHQHDCVFYKVCASPCEIVNLCLQLHLSIDCICNGYPCTKNISFILILLYIKRVYSWLSLAQSWGCPFLCYKSSDWLSNNTPWVLHCFLPLTAEAECCWCSQKGWDHPLFLLLDSHNCLWKPGALCPGDVKCSERER